ncbi:MetQ/NlpA family ABC transporter substrate-binding protein [Ureibacillus acetophenoni]|uniref:Lipoprotein n=1 Tax=Ureibacillus acetophenoni TaxID=614649 RepID=A0A285UHN8_9BACL|nr:MetQ/NlpA family ABC transporter substrate-binding protein [Ureibacillus acetophenoni]SOC41425.1 D-methionine transport system substrate-binding protein [Ureibacillus acetophenoni]
MKKLLLLALTALAALALAACGGNENSEGSDKVIKIGVNGADGAQWPVMVELAKKEGITLEVVEFTDYILPNKALAAGDIDLNAFQTISFFSNFVNESGEDLVPISTTVFAPLGVYSDKITSIDDLQKGDKVAIPNDASTLPRALNLLQEAGVLELSDDFGITGDETKITSNPLELEIIPMEPQQTARVLPDVTISLINNGIAAQAGLTPTTDAIYYENSESETVEPYINIMAARAEEADNEDYLKIAELYHTPEVEEAIKEEFKGSQIIIRKTAEETATMFENMLKYYK